MTNYMHSSEEVCFILFCIKVYILCMEHSGPYTTTDIASVRENGTLQLYNTQL